MNGESTCERSVPELKRYVERMQGVSVANQLMMIAGGEILGPDKRVCSYAGGTVCPILSSHRFPSHFPIDHHFNCYTLSILILIAIINCSIARTHLLITCSYLSANNLFGYKKHTYLYSLIF